jgi:hypothetical protein
MYCFIDQSSTIVWKLLMFKEYIYLNVELNGKNDVAEKMNEVPKEVLLGLNHASSYR